MANAKTILVTTHTREVVIVRKWNAGLTGGSCPLCGTELAGFQSHEAAKLLPDHSPTGHWCDAETNTDRTEKEIKNEAEESL